MSRNLFNSEAKFLERARVALTNVQTHEVIKPLMAEFNFGDEGIAEGWEVYQTAKNIWELKQNENAETKIVSDIYKKEYEELQVIFKTHRDKTHIFFKKEPEIIIRLGIQGKFPIKYAEFFDKTKRFYQTIQENEEIQAKLNLIKITPEIVAQSLAKHDKLLAKRADYYKEVGESQEITKSKNIALLELRDWMDDFDSIAKVALYDKPQLLEVLGIFVRS